MPREPRWARDGPSRRAPGATMERGNPPQAGRMPGQALWVTFPAAGKSDSPSRAKPDCQPARQAPNDTKRQDNTLLPNRCQSLSSPVIRGTPFLAAKKTPPKAGLRYERGMLESKT
ncbi:hypothetical protein D3879_07910 [Pseudomonas cavernicola]|uniref:Uncharacterized protein n=1 Tax=Pseudomonas cavernicola TaxID=2320866 RepID=A0A418XL22_9PSED|nr:hypothetical protein D3879_07910 [Pseudomonas cavernicola]